jgi:hypothetical protein
LIVAITIKAVNIEIFIEPENSRHPQRYNASIFEIFPESGMCLRGKVF